MSVPYLDTDVIIRYLTGDDPAKEAAAAAMFARVDRGELELMVTDTVIADATYVLASPVNYQVPRQRIAELLSALLRSPGIRAQNKSVLLEILMIYGSTNLDFGDAFIIASMRHTGTRTLYSYDRDFDRFPDIDRTEP